MTPLHGGVVVGEGATGCVLRPALPCQGAAGPPQANRVSKLMRAPMAESEAERVRRIRPQVASLPQKYRDYFILGDDLCVPNITSDAELAELQRYCSRTVSAAEVSARNFSNYRIMNQEDGGVTMAASVMTLTTPQDLQFFCSLWIHLITAIRAMNDSGVLHNDIKGDNIVLSPPSPQDPPKMRLIDWSHALLISDLYTLTGLRQSQLSTTYSYPFYHPPWMVLFDLQQAELDQIFALNHAYAQSGPAGAQAGERLVALALALSARYLTGSASALAQANFKMMVWNVCLRVYPIPVENKAQVEDVFGSFFPPGVGTGPMSRDCSMLFASSVLSKLLRLTDMDARNQLVDCEARYDVDMYATVTAMVVALQGMRHTGDPLLLEARDTVLRELAPILVAEVKVDVDFLKHRLRRIYYVDPPCSPTRAFPFLPGGASGPVPGGASGLVPGGAALEPIPLNQVGQGGDEFSPGMQVEFMRAFQTDLSPAPPLATAADVSMGFSPGFFNDLNAFIGRNQPSL